MTNTIISHSLESDSDCSDIEQDATYADVIKRKLNMLAIRSSCENGLAKQILKVSSTDFILSFVSHKVLSCEPVRSSYTKIKSKLEFIKNKESNAQNVQNIETLIRQQHEINNDLEGFGLLIPVVSNTLRQQYDDFQKRGNKLIFNDDLKLDGSIEDIVHKVRRLVFNKYATQSDIDFIESLKPFIQSLTNKAIPKLTIDPISKLTSNPIQTSNNKLCNELTPSILDYLTKLFIKNRIYKFPDDIKNIMTNKKQYFTKAFNQEAKKTQKELLLEWAFSKYKIHKTIYEVESKAIQYHDQYNQHNYGTDVKNADFLPQVLYYARTIKNLIKNKILSQDDYQCINHALPHTTENIPVMVRIYNTLATNIFVHNIGSYADIAKENIFDTYMQYFLQRTPQEINVKKEAALYVLMQIEVIRNPSALLTNVMFLLLVKAKFESLRYVDAEDSKYCWANIEKQLPVAMKNAVQESLSIEHNMFLHGLISGKRLFDYRQIINKFTDNDYVQLSYRNSDILFDWICYTINAKEILGKLNAGLNNQTTLIVNDIQYNVTDKNENIILTSPEYILCFKLSDRSSTHYMITRNMSRKIADSNNKDGNITPPSTTKYALDSINKLPLNVFDQIIKHYKVNKQEIKLDKLQGCVNTCVEPREVQKYTTPTKCDSNKNYKDNKESDEENSSQECSANKIPRLDYALQSGGNDDVDMTGDEVVSFV